jgi:predicted permease
MPGLILVTLLSALACYFLAKSRSADRRFWALMGLFLGPLAIPFVFFAKPRTGQEPGAGT